MKGRCPSTTCIKKRSNDLDPVRSLQQQQHQEQQQPHPHQQGGLDFAQSFGNTGSGIGYDPIKSGMSQLKENTPHDQQSSIPASSLFGNSAGSESTFYGFGRPSQQKGSRPGSVHPSPQVKRSICEGPSTFFGLDQNPESYSWQKRHRSDPSQRNQMGFAGQ